MLDHLTMYLFIVLDDVIILQLAHNTY